MVNNQNEVFIVYTDRFNETHFINDDQLAQLERVLENEALDTFKIEEQNYQKSDVGAVRVNGYKGFILNKMDAFQE